MTRFAPRYYALRSDADLADLDTFLGFMARFVLDSKTVASIMRWNMTTLRENPWYAEILAEGREEGREGMLEMIQRAITLRFGSPDASLLAQTRHLSSDQLVALFDVVMGASSVDAVAAHLAATQSN